MEFGVFTVSDITRDPITGYTPSEAERIDATVQIAKKAEEVGLDVFAVGVTCPVDILEARERARGDRVHGRARGLVDVVHRFLAYDAMVDTGALSAEAAAAQIVTALSRR